MSHSRWVQIEGGRLTIWHRPKIKALRALKHSGCDEIVTLLSEKEGGRELGLLVQEAQMEWTWFPMENGEPPAGARKQKLLDFLPQIAEKLKAGKSVLIHCSAGIHRTGMVAYALLRSIGYEQKEAMDLIAEMRFITATSLQSKHLDWLTKL